LLPEFDLMVSNEKEGVTELVAWTTLHSHETHR
jgi:hypothetical protein